MLFNEEEFNNNHPTRHIKNALFDGMLGFKQSLEKHFFSNITVKNYSLHTNQINLIIELDCNLTLSEMLMHFNQGNWGTFNQLKYSLSKEIQFLEKMNKIDIDVDEFSIILKDTSIIINKIYDQSIADQLDNILNALDEQYIQFTKGNWEVPYEIFVAVFEEDLIPNDLPLLNTKKTQNYNSYWALYFDSSEEAVIYDLKKSKFIYDDLYMLND